MFGWYAKHPAHGFWATHEAATGAFIGWFHYRPAKVAPHDLELGYRLRRDAWGKGYATEGSRGLIAHAFDVLRDPRIVAHAFRANRASTRVMEKVGMVFEREELEDGQPLDWYAHQRAALTLSSGDYSAARALAARAHAREPHPDRREDRLVRRRRRQRRPRRRARRTPRPRRGSPRAR